MSTEKMRKSFQEWANTHYLLSELNWAIEDGEYEEPEMQYAWEAWQASRAAIEVELPEGSSLFMRMYGVGCDMTLLIERDKAVKAIESLGLKVKP